MISCGVEVRKFLVTSSFYFQWNDHTKLEARGRQISRDSHYSPTFYKTWKKKKFILRSKNRENKGSRARLYVWSETWMDKSPLSCDRYSQDEIALLTLKWVHWRRIYMVSYELWAEMVWLLNWGLLHGSTL